MTESEIASLCVAVHEATLATRAAVAAWILAVRSSVPIEYRRGAVNALLRADRGKVVYE